MSYKKRGPINQTIVDYMNTTNCFVVPDDEYDEIVEEVKAGLPYYTYIQNDCGDEHNEECKCPKVSHEFKSSPHINLVKNKRTPLTIVRAYRATCHAQFRDVIPEREVRASQAFFEKRI